MGDIEPFPGAHVMNASQSPSHQATGYELRFRSLSAEGRVQAFPCDAEGHVDIDALSERTRLEYFYARTVIGREFSRPAVQASNLH
jgi:hypothetical protein